MILVRNDTDEYLSLTNLFKHMKIAKFVFFKKGKPKYEKKIVYI